MTALPRDEDGHIVTSAEFGESYMVEVEYNTDFDGRVIDPEKEEYPRTFHGPFTSEEEAVEWMEDRVPDDTDVHDVRSVVLNNVRPKPAGLPAIVYEDEAHDSWMGAIDRMRLFVAALHRADGTTEEVVILGSGVDDTDGFPTLRYQAYDDEAPFPFAVGDEQVIRSDQFNTLEVY